MLKINILHFQGIRRRRPDQWMIILAHLPLFVIFLLILKHICIAGEKKCPYRTDYVSWFFFFNNSRQLFQRSKQKVKQSISGFFLDASTLPPCECSLLKGLLWVCYENHNVYILPLHLISQQWNLGLHAHEMKTSSESIDFYYLLVCRSLPQKLAAWRQA